MFRLRLIFGLFLVFSTTILVAQKSLNSYKYIVIPNQYEFQKSEDQYQVNSLVQFLFEKQGYTVFLSNESFPEDLAKNPCLALKAIVLDDSGMLSTKLSINLFDCYNTVVFTSIEGKSKLKDYHKAYHEAIRKAFVGIQELNYEYDGSNTDLNVVENQAENVSPAKVAVVASITIPVVEENVEKEVVSNKAVEPEKTAPIEQVAANPVSEVTATTKVTETALIAPVVVPKKSDVSAVKEIEKVFYTIDGKYFIDMWGECIISKKDDGYTVVGGDQNFEFATISKTSKPTIFMVKKTGFTQSQLLELNEDGNLQIDTDSGVKIFKRID